MKLVDASEKYLSEYRMAYLEAVKLVDLGAMKKHNMMFLNPDEEDIVEHFNMQRDKTKIPSYYVPSYDYFMINDEDKFVGIVHIRIQLTEGLMNYGGHIGYAINPNYFKQGYGTLALKLALEKAKEIVVDEKILVTCDDDNIGSYKIIERNGGVLENKVNNSDMGEEFITRRYWINK